MNYTYDRNWGCRISDEHAFRGLRTLVMENELVRVTVLLDKGADIYEFLYKPLDIDFMWRGPQPLRNPALSLSAGPREAGNFQDYYHGGWQEIFPNGGAPCKYKGVELGQHGEVSVVPWNCEIVEDTPDAVAARMWTRTFRTPFLIERTMRLEKGRAVMRFDERIVNEGCEEMEFMWGHHPAFGAPFLDESCRIDCPASRVETHYSLDENSRLEPDKKYDSYPVVTDKNGEEMDLSEVPPPDIETAEMVYLLGLDEGWYAITNTNRRVGFGMRWDVNVFPVVWLWEVFGGSYGYPWYGRTYNLALEPWTSHPGGMDVARERGATACLAPGAALETSLLAVAYVDVDEVHGIDENGVVS